MPNMRGMQSLTTDIAIAYGWLAIGAAAMLGGLFAKFKNAGHWAWPVVVGSICLMGCDREPSDQNLARAEAELASEKSLHAETRKLIETAQRDRDDHARRLVDLEMQLAAEKARHAETRDRLDGTEKTARSDREQYGQRLARVEAELAREKSLHAETRMLLQAAQRDWDDSNRRLAELDTELAAEKARHAETRKRLEAAGARGPERQPKGYAGELYSAVLLNETELVAGKKGIYHAIRLFSPARETIPKFDLGSYRLDTTRHQEVARAFAELNREVVSVLATGHPVTIFVRGRANNIGFKGPGALHAGLCSGNSVSYLPYDRSAKKYASAATKQVLARTYTNQKLPNLRAAFIACIAQANIQPAELIILQGEIAETTDRRALTAEMFLFAGAPAKAVNP
jgi:hypothetical protein